MTKPYNTFPYRCEKCPNVVRLTQVEYDDHTRGGKGRFRCEDCGPPIQLNPVSRRRQQRNRKDRNAYRDDAGIIATIRDQETGDLRTLHQSGFLRDAVPKLCKRIDNLPGVWLVVSLSTPRTIATDLKGRCDKDIRPVEQLLLSGAGRTDLLEQRSLTPALDPALRRSAA